MSFSSFSKDFTANMYTVVENQFITKYLPQADGDAVRAYLYGLYLCSCKEEFDAVHVASVLKIPPEKLVEIFGFWEDCDLVRVLSREPLFVEYLPVNAAVGRPKSVKPEKYAQFNKEFYKILQKVGKDFKPYEMQRILEFLENNPMQQQAFLLVAQYCAKKDGAKLTASHILNKANKLCSEHKYTYEQVEETFSGFNNHEKDLEKIFSLLGIYRKPQEDDYGFLNKWLEEGMETEAVFTAARHLKKGTLSTLDLLIDELIQKDAKTKKAAGEYLVHREEITSVVYKVGRKLGIKIQNPRPYAEEYAEKWLERGYEEDSLCLIAALSLKLGYGFAEMDNLLDNLYREGIVDDAGVSAYCAGQDKQLKLLQKIQSVCGVVRKTQTVLDMLSAWQSWHFSDEMIMEAAKLSANASAPIPYMNKLLSEWKRLGVAAVSEIPAKGETATPVKTYRSEAAIAADKRTDRESHYARLRAKAQARAENIRRIAENDSAFTQADAAVRSGEIALAKAEVFEPQSLPLLTQRLSEAKEKRTAALQRLNLTDEDFLPQYECKKCSDTGFLPDGKPCDCYRD